MSPGGYMSTYSPSPSSAAPLPPLIPPIRSPGAAGGMSDQEKYLAELLAEYKNLTPFLSVLPLSSRLFNQEILRITTLLGNAQILDQSGLEHAWPLASGGLYSTGRSDVNIWASPHQSEISGLLHHSSPQRWLGSHGHGGLVKKVIRVDIPVEKYPHFNFVGRLLGPRGHSLKRIEASTDCRILIRGRGSIKDPTREEMLRGDNGYEHLNEPLHILVEAELPAEIIDARLIGACRILKDLITPVDESQDFFKKDQLRELAMLNRRHSEDDPPHMSGSVSPFHGIHGMKRAKTHG